MKRADQRFISESLNFEVADGTAINELVQALEHRGKLNIRSFLNSMSVEINCRNVKRYATWVEKCREWMHTRGTIAQFDLASPAPELGQGIGGLLLSLSEVVPCPSEVKSCLLGYEAWRGRRRYSMPSVVSEQIAPSLTALTPFSFERLLEHQILSSQIKGTWPNWRVKAGRLRIKGRGLPKDSAWRSIETSVQKDIATSWKIDDFNAEGALDVFLVEAPSNAISGPMLAAIGVVEQSAAKVEIASYSGKPRVHTLDYWEPKDPWRGILDLVINETLSSYIHYCKNLRSHPFEVRSIGPRRLPSHPRITVIAYSTSKVELLIQVRRKQARIKTPARDSRKEEVL